MKYFLLLLLLTGCAPARREVSPYLIGDKEPLAPPQKVVPASSYKKKEAITVFLDPGHGGESKGTLSHSKRLQEKTLTLETAKRVERLLAAKGYRVFMSRRKDVFVSLPERVQMAAKRQSHIFVSIHYNFTKNTEITGAEIFYFHNPKQPTRENLSRALATSILKKLTEKLPTVSRGVKAGNFCVIREASMPSVLIEAAFLSNPKDERLLRDVRYRNKIAEAIADGIDEYFHSKNKK